MSDARISVEIHFTRTGFDNYTTWHWGLIGPGTICCYHSLELKPRKGRRPNTNGLVVSAAVAAIRRVLRGAFGRNWSSR